MAQILIGAAQPSAQPALLDLRYANRHGLVAGATGTGKTVSLQVLAEAFSAAGVAVFAADIKGDLSGIAVAAQPSEKLLARAAASGVADYRPLAAPVICWDVYGEQGHPLRATVSDFGPELLARLMELSDTQAAVLTLAFKYADDHGLLLIDLKDLRALLQYVAEHAAELGQQYGLISSASVAAIQRGLLQLEAAGAEHFFGEPALELQDLLRQDASGRGAVNLLAADKLYRNPRLYACVLLWLLAELFEELPERGDADAPLLAFFFDEAHLLFRDAPKALIEQIEQVVRLIRSKGVGIYFVTQSPLDLPEAVLGQLGNRVQHALRAFTPRDQKAVRTAADTFRPNPALDTAAVITEMGVGEALVSVLGEHGVPTPVERVRIRPPASRIGPLSSDERRLLIERSPLAGAYEQRVDRESAYEQLQANKAAAAPAAAAGRISTQQWQQQLDDVWGPASGRRSPPRRSAPARSGARQGVGETVVKSVARNVAGQVGRELGRQLVRGLLGALKR